MSVIFLKPFIRKTPEFPESGIAAVKELTSEAGQTQSGTQTPSFNDFSIEKNSRKL